MNAHATKICRPGRLVDHASCWEELRSLKAERDALKQQLAELRVELLRAAAVSR